MPVLRIDRRHVDEATIEKFDAIVLAKDAGLPHGEVFLDGDAPLTEVDLGDRRHSNRRTGGRRRGHDQAGRHPEVADVKRLNARPLDRFEERRRTLTFFGGKDAQISSFESLIAQECTPAG